MALKQQLGESSNPPLSIEGQFNLILQALRKSNNRQEIIETCMNVTYKRLSELTERFNRFFTLGMVGQAPLPQLERKNAPSPIATLVLNPAIASVTPQVVNSQTLPQSTSPTQTPLFFA